MKEPQKKIIHNYKLTLTLLQAERGFSEFEDSVGSTFIAGFCRRSVPHCFTTNKGPEQYEVGGHPV